MKILITGVKKHVSASDISQIQGFQSVGILFILRKNRQFNQKLRQNSVFLHQYPIVSNEKNYDTRTFTGLQKNTPS